MRTIFLLLCILSVTVTAHSQSKRFDKFVPGSFVDTTNKVYTGYVSWTLADQNIFGKGKGGCISYKENKDADFVYVSTNFMKSFTMEADTFMVIKNKDFKLNPIIKIVLSKNPEKLYSYLPYTPGGNYGNPTAAMNGLPGYSFAGGIDLNYSVFYTGPDAEHLTRVTKENFAELLSKVMADKPEVLARISNQTFDHKHIGDLVKYYKTGELPKNVK
ncbi:hypothetical protein [Mucilaginibacter celer]|uniref:Uncharacterized protein n=1 Tax=Mucilaginibacter celer TaxID=2305508 RepID=A0A494VXQ8_9SPHI|nr:hypothetical protein [Mucilaginibacter celer]AYL96035.1 hypothetical protein HYN43_012385 [Mucilaginibacter celer]